MFRARKACKANVLGLPSIVLDLFPAFSQASPWVLWGRTDFMATFRVMIDEKNSQFNLYW